MMALMGAAGMGMGALQAQDARAKERRDALMAAEVARWSPWTKMQPGQIDRAGSNMQYMGQGALSGAAMGQNISQASAYQDYLNRTAAPSQNNAPQTAPSVPTPGVLPPPKAMTDLPSMGMGPVNTLRATPQMTDEFGAPLDVERVPYTTWLRMGGR